jgi:TATA-binding protein-associated factor
MKSVLENLSDLWDAEQYDSEYNLETFMRSLE